MNFTLTINGETPAELLAALQQLTAPTAQPPQSEPATPQEKPKVPAPAEQKKPVQKPTAASAATQPEPPVKEQPQANPTAPDEPQASTPAQTAPSEATATVPSSEPEKDPATEGKVRSLIMALMKQGKQAECKQIINSTGAKSISSLPPESYTAVWEQLCRLKEEVDADAAG